MVATTPVTDRRQVRHRRAALFAVVGWLALAGAYWLVLPAFGVVSAATWSVTWLCWLWAIGVPTVAAGRLAAHGPRRAAAGIGALAILAATCLWAVGPPQRSVEGQVRHHRHDLARLAADFRAGRIGAGTALPWRLRPLSVDGRAHRRCAGAGEGCALFLLLWQDWRGERGTGLAYYPTPPRPDASLVTAAGDVGVPTRDLGDGWWLVE